MMSRVLFASLVVLTMLVGCGKPRNPPPSATATGAESPAGNLFGDAIKASRKSAETPIHESPDSVRSNHQLQFVDIARPAGLQFEYINGEAGRSLMVETVGGGVGALDYDLDGNCDLFFCQGGDPSGESGSEQPAVALFRNAPLASFQNVALPAGLAHYGYGQGVAVGDYNHDGFEDVYLTCVGRNTLLENMGDGTFRDITVRSGTGGSQWSSSAAFADLTGDGNLDLYVCNYVAYDPRDPLDCRNSKGEYRICHPREIPPCPDDCFVNLGNGEFREQAKRLGLVGDGSKGLGVAIADFDVDGEPDIYVGNDTTANFLFTRKGDEPFHDAALLRGCAVNYEGLLQASMGLAVGDYDRNGFLDIYSTHFYEESNTLYRNLGEVGFQDVTGRAGLHTPTLQSLAWGTAMHDFDQDGWQEIFVTNGHVENYPDNPIHEMRPQLFRFDGSTWQEQSDSAGDFFRHRYVGRGVALADIDNDGDHDLVVVHQNSPAALLRNESERGHWLKVRLIGRRSPRFGVGCRVTVTAGQVSFVQELFAGGSFASSHQSALLFGLGESSQPCRVEIRWPSGQIQTLEEVEVNHALVVEEPD